jgi:hypothetical protein
MEVDVLAGPDGTLSAIKPASTAALSSDPALVVTTNGSTTSNIPVNQTVGTVSVVVLAANPARRELIIVNTGVTVIYLGLGQTPTVNAFHIPLNAGSSVNDGTGGNFVSDTWKGSVSAIGPVSNGSIVVTELS